MNRVYCKKFNSYIFGHYAPLTTRIKIKKTNEKTGRFCLDRQTNRHTNRERILINEFNNVRMRFLRFDYSPLNLLADMLHCWSVR